MTISSLRRPLYGCLVLTVLTSCGGAQSSLGVLTPAREASHASRPRLPFAPTGRVAIWVADTTENYLVGLERDAKTFVSAIDLDAQDCLSPISVKVDHARNIWTTCKYNGPMGIGPRVLEYGADGTFEWGFLPTCPIGTTCYSSSGSDGATDGNGNVFASILYDYSSGSGPGIVYWPPPPAPSQLIALGQECNPFCTINFLDVDTNENVYFDFESFTSFFFMYGVGEVTNATTNPQFKLLLQPGTLQYPGGIYVSNHDTVLNVIDSTNRTISQYHLTPSFNSTPFNVMTTQADSLGFGDPVSGGFNKSDSKVVVGDMTGWLDLCNVSSASCSIKQSLDVVAPEGAAYTPSDK